MIQNLFAILRQIQLPVQTRIKFAELFCITTVKSDSHTTSSKRMYTISQEGHMPPFNHLELPVYLSVLDFLGVEMIPFKVTWLLMHKLRLFAL